MEKIVSVKTIPIQYGDAQIKCHKIYSSGTLIDVNSGEGTFHSHKYYECHFMEKNSTKLRTVNGDITISQSEMLIIPPDFGHFSIIPDDSFQSHVFEFSLECVESDNNGIYKLFKELLDKSSLTPIKISQKLLSLTRDFSQSSFDGTIGDYCASIAQVANIVSALFNEINTCNTTKKLTVDMTDIKTMIDAYVSMPEKTLDDLAQVTAYSRRQISRIVRNLYGMSLSDLRNRRRVQTAKDLLKNTEYTIDRIAFDSGFKSTNAMREAFKKYENMTPSDYKKQI